MLGIFLKFFDFFILHTFGRFLQMAALKPPQVEISVILTLVTDLNHAWSQGYLYFYLGPLCIVLGDIYYGISCRLRTQNVHLETQILITRQNTQV